MKRIIFFLAVLCALLVYFDDVKKNNEKDEMTDKVTSYIEETVTENPEFAEDQTEEFKMDLASFTKIIADNISLEDIKLFVDLQTKNIKLSDIITYLQKNVTEEDLQKVESFVTKYKDYISTLGGTETQ